MVGKLQSVDGFMNIALEGTKELVNNKTTNSFGDVFIRGNNGELIDFYLVCEVTSLTFSFSSLHFCCVIIYLMYHNPFFSS